MATCVPVLLGGQNGQRQEYHWDFQAAALAPILVKDPVLREWGRVIEKSSSVSAGLHTCTGMLITPPLHTLLYHTHVPHTCAHSPPTPTHSQTSLNIHIKNCIDLFYMYEGFACMYDVYPIHAWCPQRSTEDIRSSGTEVRTWICPSRLWSRLCVYVYGKKTVVDTCIMFQGRTCHLGLLGCCDQISPAVTPIRPSLNCCHGRHTPFLRYLHPTGEVPVASRVKVWFLQVSRGQHWLWSNML